MGHMRAIFGIAGNENAAYLTHLGLYAMQHRAQNGAGITSADGTTMHSEGAVGYVSEIFNPERLASLPGSTAIGHTTPDTNGVNPKPLLIDGRFGKISVVNNGSFIAAEALRKQLQTEGAIFQSTSDTEVVLHLYTHSELTDPQEALIDALKSVHCAFSLIFLTPTQLIAARDPYGFRPLVLGRLGEAWIVASETCALDLLGAIYEREVEPGEVLIIESGSLTSLKPFETRPHAFCLFEDVYFARPDSLVFGQDVTEVRSTLGRQLAIEAPATADVVVPVPDSGVCAAIGFAEQSGIPLQMGLIRNHYVGRTFIEPTEHIRNLGTKVKLNPVKSILNGKRVVLVDDSIMRGVTSKKIVKMVREAGASEVHVRISCPPTTHRCYYGGGNHKKEELIASTKTPAEIQAHIGADTLGFLSLPGLLRVLAPNQDSYCTACYTGQYPVEPSGAGSRRIPLRPIS